MTSTGKRLILKRSTTNLPNFKIGEKDSFLHPHWICTYRRMIWMSFKTISETLGLHFLLTNYSNSPFSPRESNLSSLTPTTVVGVKRSSASVILSVCLSVCLSTRKTKTAETTVTKIASWVFANQLILDQKVKDQDHSRVTKCKNLLKALNRVADVGELCTLSSAQPLVVTAVVAGGPSWCHQLVTDRTTVCASQLCQYCFHTGQIFTFFAPQGATCCTNQCEI